MKQKLIKFVRWPAFTAFVLLIVLLLINEALSPGYLTKTYIVNFLGSNGPMMIACLGLAVVLICGGMDISVGALMGLINVIYVTMSMKGMSTALTLACCVVIGTACGLLNGVCVALFRITPILTTFATSYIFKGLALYIMPSPTGAVPKGILSWYYSWLGGFGGPLTFILLAVILWLIIKRTRLGVMLYAIGASKQNAYVSGIPVSKVNLFSYTFAGFVYTLAALAMTTYCSGGDATIAEAITMKAIAACVIGGVLLSGGVGDAIGACFGAISLGLAITTVLAVVKSTYYQNLATGVLMLVAVVGCTLINRVIAKKTAQGREKVNEDEEAE